MAVTVEQSPTAYAPAYNKMEYLISSTNSAETDFSYLVDIYINGSGTKTVRLRIPIRPSDSLGIVDIHRVLETALASDVPSPTSVLGANDAPNSNISYIIEFGEEYDVAGTLTQFVGLTVTSAAYAFNGSLEKQEWIDYNPADYRLTTDTNKFYTNCPSTQNVSIEDHGYLYMNTDQANNLVHWAVRTYDSAGTLITTFNIDPVSGSTDILYIASAPASLNLISNAQLLVGTQPIIPSTVASYDITTWGIGARIISETKTYVIKEACKFEENNLIFLNKLGGFDHFSFINGDSSSYSIERKTMKVNVDTVTGSTIVHSMQDREKVQYYTKNTETIKLMSDWITEEESAWLLELIESPEIYLQNGNDLIAVSNIKATGHVKKKVARDKLFRLDVELELGYDNYRQRY